MEEQFRAGEELDGEGESGPYTFVLLALPTRLTVIGCQCADLEARSQQVERCYLDVLQPLLEAQNLEKEQREALQQLVQQSQQRALQSSARNPESR